MGMPIAIEIVDPQATEENIDEVFGYFHGIDEKFSTYKPGSEISQINRKELQPKNYSAEMLTVLDLCENWKQKTNGYFDIQKQFKNFYVEAGGDIEACGLNADNKPWVVGIKNPFAQEEIIKVLEISNQGLATSGTYIRGQHIYNPKLPGQQITDIISLTVIGPNVYEADRFATAAFAMENAGINYLNAQPGLQAYLVDSNGIATMTTGLEKYLKNN